MPLDDDACLFERLPDDGVVDVLALVELPGRKVQHPVGVAGALPLGKAHGTVALEDEHHVVDGELRGHCASSSGRLDGGRPPCALRARGDGPCAAALAKGMRACPALAGMVPAR
ncbi:hypothetical protein ADL04_27595 [Streptomyces sp. NRRL B-3648]|nr:hypothetical protein ADL04_27595 [Streptomyces sp. NRRL B-3648]